MTRAISQKVHDVASALEYIALHLSLVELEVDREEMQEAADAEDDSSAAVEAYLCHVHGLAVDEVATAIKIGAQAEPANAPLVCDGCILRCHAYLLGRANLA